MELGSPEHKQLLLNSIIKSSVRISSIGFVIGLILMVPMLIRENTFSSGLFYAGMTFVIGSLVYALILGFKKYQKIIQPFDQQFNQQNEK